MRSFLFLLLLALSACEKTADREILKLAVEDYNNEEYQLCQKRLHSYLRKYPLDESAWELLGTASEKLGHDSLSREAYKKALTINRKCYRALTGLGIQARKAGNYAEAERLYLKSLSIEPDNVGALSSLMVIEMHRKNYSKAVEYGEKSLRLGAGNQVKSKLAIAYHYNRQFPERDTLIKELEMLRYKSIDELHKLQNGETEYEF